DGIRDRNVTGVQTCALPIYGVAAEPDRDVLGEKLAEKSVKVMDAVLALYRESSAVVVARTQSALHAFADADVFLLNLVAEIDDEIGRASCREREIIYVVAVV